MSGRTLRRGMAGAETHKITLHAELLGLDLLTRRG
jgi:hypothetical protein